MRPALVPTSLWTRALVKRLISHNGKRIEAVEVEKDGETLQLKSKIVVVAVAR
ncbi:MAG: hypothetical protein R2865_01800 [Deinococcales bacterium]